MRYLIALVLASLCVVPAGTRADAEQNGGREEFTAFAVSTGGPRTSPVATTVDIVIERWSSEAERQRLAEALGKGQDTMLDTLQDLRRVGFIRTPGNLGYDLHYAHQMPGEDGGRRIFIATDRPISFWEAVNRPRTIDYPFTFIELRLNNEGTGEGKLSLATRVIAGSDGRMIQLENYDTQPVQLNEVKKK
jgi:hypothetical protein